MPHGTQSCHVERTPHRPTATVDAADAALSATVPVVWGDSRQSGGGLRGQFSKLRHFRQHGGGDHGADPRDGVEPFGFVSEFGILRDQFGDGGITLFHLPLQSFAQVPELSEAESISVLLGMVAFDSQQLDELAAPLGEISQLLLLWRGRGAGGGLELRPVFGEHGGVNWIGLGALALGASEVADASGFHDADRDAGGVEDAHDGLFVAAGGFADDLGVGMNPQKLEQLRVSLVIVGQGMKAACEV